MSLRFLRLRSLYFRALFGAIILLVPTLLNSYPFFYSDSRTYVRGGDYAIRKIINERFVTIWSNVEIAGDESCQAPSCSAAAKSDTGNVGATVLLGRSVYYGILVYLGYVVSDFWLTAFLQAYIVAAIVGLLYFRCWQFLGVKEYFVALTLLSVLTPLGFFVGLMMPDIFASVAILATMMTFIYWRQLKAIDIVFLAGILVLSFVSHSSHIAFTLVILPLLIIIGIWSKQDRVAQFGALTLIVVCLGTGVAAELAFYKITLKTTGRPPLRLPYLTARLIELGPGLRYLDHACLPPQYAVCAYRPQLPLLFDTFLFDPKGVFEPADFERKKQLSEEQNRFALHVFLFEPVQFIGGLMYDFGRQLIMVSLDNIEISYFNEKFPQRTREKIEASKFYQHPEIAQLWSTVNYLVVFLAIAVVILKLRKLRSNESEMGNKFTLFLSLTILGVLANAAVCGILASPQGRFQARVIWLVPLLACASWFITERLESPNVRPQEAANNLLAG